MIEKRRKDKRRKRTEKMQGEKKREKNFDPRVPSVLVNFSSKVYSLQ